jgi:hypothetical protein
VNSSVRAIEPASVYVGSSLNMPNRVAKHRSNGRPFDHAFYIATNASQRGRLDRTRSSSPEPAKEAQAAKTGGK